MARTGRTTDLVKVIGDTSFLDDFSEVSQDGGVSDTVPVGRVALNGQRYTSAFATSLQVDPSFGTVYAGDETDALRARLPLATDPWAMVIDSQGQFFYAMRAFVPGLDESAPSTDAITESLEMQQSSVSKPYAGAGAVAVTPFTFTSSASSFTVGNVPANASLLIVVTDYSTGISSANITLAGRSQGVGAAGIWQLPSQTTAQTNATVAASHSITGNNTIVGYALVGEELGID